jgi:ketosteroid isomerase-like protein
MSAMPASATAAHTRATDVARAFFAAYDAHEVNKMVGLCSEDAQLRYVGMGSDGEGKARELGAAIWSGLIDKFPDLHVTPQSMFGGERNVAAEVMIGGTQRKDLTFGRVHIANQGKHYELPHAFLLQVDDSKRLITEIACYWDNVSFYKQLGKTTLD